MSSRCAGLAEGVRERLHPQTVALSTCALVHTHTHTRPLCVRNVSGSVKNPPPPSHLLLISNSTAQAAMPSDALGK